MRLRRIRKSWGALLRPSCVSASDYGLELTVERGTGIGPWACCSSDRPMHSPVLAPVHGMLSISGSPPGEVSPATGEFGTRSGTHTPVKVSSDSPPGHAAIVGELVDTATTARAGAAATATANPPARISRRAGSFRVAIITLSVVALLIVCHGNRYRAASSLHALHEFPADGSSEVVAAEAICYRKHYADYLENAVPSSIKMVLMSHFWELAVNWLWHRFTDASCGTVMCNPHVVFQANEVVRCG
jgi:hypothetical protein